MIVVQVKPVLIIVFEDDFHEWPAAEKRAADFVLDVLQHSEVLDGLEILEKKKTRVH